MTYPLWPIAMRQQGGAGVTGAPQVNVAGFTPEIGPSIDRRRATSFTSIYNIDFAMLSVAEYTAFRTFFHTTLKDGSLPFAWRHPMTDELMKCKFYMRDGGAYEETRVTPTAYAIRCQVQFISLLDSDAYEVISEGNTPEIGAVFDFLTGKYAIVDADYVLDTGNISNIINFSRASVATYFGSDGLLKTAASGAMRYTYDPVTLAIRGFLIEEARTNVALWNRDCTNAAWTKTNITAAKTQVGIDGVTNSASSLTATSSNGTCLQAITLASSARRQSAYIKRLVGTGNVQMTTDNGSTWTTLTITSAWARYTIPAQTLANPTIGFRLATSGDSIAVDYIQNENGSFPTSAIATTTVAVARAADVGYMLLSALPHNAAAYSLVAEYIHPYSDAVNNATAVSLNDATFDNYSILFSNASDLPVGAVVVGTVSQATPSNIAVTPGNVVKQAMGIAANDFALYSNGIAATPDTSGSVPTVTRIDFGQLAGAYGWLNGPLRQVALYARRRPGVELSILSVAA